jgi:hypothetical protein|nr:MAG TPA: hypothetical protein [Caudoviricetes sp.]
MLKQLISLLLSKFFSKQETALVGHQAMPNDGGTTITTTPTVVGINWTTVASFTAPSDGYCFARIRPSAIFGFVQISAGEGINAVAATNTANEGQWVHLTLAMSKGAQAKVQVSNADNIVVKFFSIIGGGYNLIKKYSLLGGAICLKSLLACLQRNFSTKNGLKSQPLHLPNLKRILTFQQDSMGRTNGVMSLRLRSMGGSELRLLQPRQSLSILVPMAVRCVNPLLERHLDLFHVSAESRRVRVLITSSLQRGLFRIEEFCLFQAAVPSPVNGGVSC